MMPQVVAKLKRKAVSCSALLGGGSRRGNPALGPDQGGWARREPGGDAVLNTLFEKDWWHRQRAVSVDVPEYSIEAMSRVRDLFGVHVPDSMDVRVNEALCDLQRTPVQNQRGE